MRKREVRYPEPYGEDRTLEKRSSDGISISPTNSPCNLITDDCKEAIECSTMAFAISSSRLASRDRLFCSCKLLPIYYHNSHFESEINLEGDFLSKEYLDRALPLTRSILLFHIYYQTKKILAE